jgi:hypothetical protein
MISMGIVVSQRSSGNAVSNNTVIPSATRDFYNGAQEEIPHFILNDGNFLDSRSPIGVEDKLYGNDNLVLFPAHQINFSSFVSSLALGAVAYQLSGNPIIAFLSSTQPLFYATSVVATPHYQKRVVNQIFSVNSFTTGNQISPHVAYFPAGGFVVIWVGYQTGIPNIYAQLYASNGDKVGVEFQIDSSARDQNEPNMATLSTGDFFVVWRDGYDLGMSDIYGRQYFFNGTAAGMSFLINTNTFSEQAQPDITALSTGDFVVTWYGVQTGDHDVYAQRFGANGTKLGAEFLVNTVRTAVQWSPIITTLSGDSFLIVWEGDQTGVPDTYGQIFLSNGTKLGIEFLIHNRPGVGITGLPADNFAVVWNDDSLHGQLFNINNTTLGAEFFKKTNITAAYPEVVTLPDSDFIVAWGSNQAALYDIYTQRFINNGTLEGAELKINISASNPISYSIAALGDGDFIVVWQDGQVNAYDIFGYIFHSDVTTSASRTSVKSLTTITVPKTVSASEILPSTSQSSFVIPATSSSLTVLMPDTTTQLPTQKSSQTNNSIPAIAGGVAGGVVVLGGAIAACGFWKKKNKKKNVQQDENNAASFSDVSTKTSSQENTTMPPTTASPENNNAHSNSVALNSIPRSSEYASFKQEPAKPASSNYGKIDEEKKPENQYDRMPVLEI